MLATKRKEKKECPRFTQHHTENVQGAGEKHKRFSGRGDGPVSKSSCHAPMRIWVCILNNHVNAGCIAHVCDPSTPEMGVSERIPEVHGPGILASGAGINNKHTDICFKQGRRHLTLSCDLCTCPTPPTSRRFFQLSSLGKPSLFWIWKDTGQCSGCPNAHIPGCQTSEAHVLLWKENYQIKVLRMQNIFLGEKKSQVIFCHPLNTQVPRVGEEVLPRQFSLEEQICIVPYMTDVLHFFSYHN